ncbi:MAG: DUF3795 domain-containing protein [Chloroflexota bacterium]
MKKQSETTKFSPDLIAPCGMNCGICGAYLAYRKDIPLKPGNNVHCKGCRPRNKQCAFIKGRCTNPKLANNQITFCFECADFPCYSLRRLDERYRKNYQMSMIENLKNIERNGLTVFLREQREKYRCPNCGGVISVHNRKCYDCQTIESWRG